MRILSKTLAAMAVGVVALGLAAGSAFAFTADQQQALASISAKLANLKTMHGEFIQFGPTGEKSQGKFYIERPGRILFDYDPPSKLKVKSDGKSVLVRDASMKTDDLWPLSKTPLKFLLDDQLNLAKSSRVRGVQVESDLIQVVVVDDAQFGGGTLTLFFDPSTYELRQWTVRDAQGLDTTVALYNVETGRPLSPELFKINYSGVTNRARERSLGD
ncbi:MULTISPECIES: LolA family protein [unclassified Afifella]|uniref:LolA family protein n=1 Tax=unclassified Afifella TaxID=2624128 RepID=UPI001F3B3B69|nr:MULTISPECIES: outer membrane lipoprotein carrier protein LolA [unclassified Afifella]MCF1505142.1 outer membrane lipoprotein carrier protein LolA [Afifella sp. H1R]MCT8268694.1 outer membrane lipoprotein carrier protein LolA [Afifella sp. JA880]